MRSSEFTCTRATRVDALRRLSEVHTAAEHTTVQVVRRIILRQRISFFQHLVQLRFSDFLTCNMKGVSFLSFLACAQALKFVECAIRVS